MIFLKPNNLTQILYQLTLNSILRLRTSIKKKFNIHVQNKLFISGEFFESLSTSKIIFSTLKKFPQKKYFDKYKKKIWIFHNSDETFDLIKKKKLDYFKPRKCFSQNLIFFKKNYYFLPIGLENNKFYNNGDTDDFNKLRKLNYEKKPRILFGFNITNPKRVQIKKKLKEADIADETKGWNAYMYRRILSKYMFLICPEGNGIDTHRIWEAFYLRTIPIVKENRISFFLKKANLPVVILKKWSDITKFNETNLNKLYISKKKLFSNKYLFQTYWKKIFKSF